MGLSCPQCQTELVLRDDRWHCPRCDFWKESYGTVYWRKHAQNVSALRDQLKQRFPQITWQAGLGALSSERLDLPPEHKGEPDLQGWWMRRHFISIEVSGTDSDNVAVPPDPIYIGPWKLHKVAPGAAFFFYMIYRNATYTLPLAVVVEFQDRLRSVPIRGKREKYIPIPYTAARPGSDLFSLVAEELHRLDPRQALEERRR